VATMLGVFSTMVTKIAGAEKQDEEEEYDKNRLKAVNILILINDVILN